MKKSCIGYFTFYIPPYDLLDCRQLCIDTNHFYHDQGAHWVLKLGVQLLFFPLLCTPAYSKSLQFWGYRAYFGGKKPSACWWWRWSRSSIISQPPVSKINFRSNLNKLNRYFIKKNCFLSRKFQAQGKT